MTLKRIHEYEKNAGVYLRKKGYRRVKIAEIARIDEDTVTNYTKNTMKAFTGAYWRKISPAQKPIGAVYRAAKGSSLKASAHTVTKL